MYRTMQSSLLQDLSAINCCFSWIMYSVQCWLPSDSIWIYLVVLYRVLRKKSIFTNIFLVNSSHLSFWRIFCAELHFNESQLTTLLHSSYPSPPHPSAPSTPLPLRSKKCSSSHEPKCTSFTIEPVMLYWQYQLFSTFFINTYILM